MDEKSLYEEKFAEMQKFIPFLESMIKRLESNPGGGTKNPREAQLNKIKSLRNFFLNKSVKMKLENLLKCEQVMLNLYSKIGEADKTIFGDKNIIPKVNEKEKPSEINEELKIVREKLKTVVSISPSVAPNSPSVISISPSVAPNSPSVISISPSVAQNSPSVISNSPLVPKIDSASLSETALECSSNSVNKPMFERRPRRKSRSQSASSRQQCGERNRSPSSHSSKSRKYTRVLCSPEPDSKRWSNPQLQKSPRKANDYYGNQLFQRRSPRRNKSRSPRRKKSLSVSPHNKSKKKSSKKKKSPDRAYSSSLIQDVNITLNVPEESLNSLSASDIFSRIVNCNEDDVDIQHLRELRQQIVKELKQTGSNHDISDYILKSYKKKKKKDKKKEFEEGELSDSESEKVETVYGNLTIEVESCSKNIDPVKEKSEFCNTAKSSTSRKKSPKINISLVVSNPMEKIQSESISKPQLGTSVLDSPKSTTTFLVDVAHSEGRNAEIQEIVQPMVTLPNTQTDTGLFLKRNNEDHDQTQTLINDTVNLEVPSISKISSAVNKSPSENPHIISTISTERDGELLLDQSSRMVRQIANSIQAVSKPKLFYVPNVIEKEPNVQTENNLSDLLYRDLSPTKSPKQNHIQNIASKQVEIGENESKKSQQINETANTKPDGDNETIPFLDDTKNTEVISEIEILKALKNEILGGNIDIPISSDSTSMHHPKLYKVTDKYQLETDKKKRISLESYKKKSVPAQKGIFIKQTEADQVKVISKALTPRECERFGVILKGSLDDDDISDEDSPINQLLPTSDDNDDLCPKSPEKDNVIELSPKSPLIIPSDPIEIEDYSQCAIPTSLSNDTDMRVQSNEFNLNISKEPVLAQSKANQEINKNNYDRANLGFPEDFKNPDYPGNPTNVIPRQEALLPIQPLISPLTQGLSSQMGLVHSPRNSSIEPSRSKFTPSRVLMTPNYSPMYGEEHTGRRHVYAPFNSPDSSRNPWDVNSRPLGTDDGSSTPKWESRGNVKNNKDIYSVQSNIPVWDSFGSKSLISHEQKSEFTFYKSRPESFNRYEGHNNTFELHSQHQNRQRNFRDPRLCSDRKDDGYARDPRMSNYVSKNRDNVEGHMVQRKGVENDMFRPYSNDILLGDCNFESEIQKGIRGSNITSWGSDTRDRHSTLPSKDSLTYDKNTTYYPNRDFHSRSFSGSETFERNLRREVSMGRDIREEHNSNRDMHRERSIGRDPRREASMSRERREPSMGYDMKKMDWEMRRNSNVEYINQRYDPDTTRDLWHEDSIGRNNREVTSNREIGREKSVGREISHETSVSRNFKRGASISRDMRREMSTGREMMQKYNTGCNFKRDGSIGRDFMGEKSLDHETKRDNMRDFYRGKSLGRELNIGRDDTTNSNSGRSFNRENTGNRLQHEQYWRRDIRRGKSLCRSVSPELNKRYARAKSVGRESLKNISCDNITVFNPMKIETSNPKRFNVARETINVESRKDSREMATKPNSLKNVKYSERRSNSRDPRNKKEDYNVKESSSRSSSTSSYQSNHSRSSKSSYCESASDSRSYKSSANKNYCRGKESKKNKSAGIVYTTDNIAKGKILSHGYGVKNYKIPKIKKPCIQESDCKTKENQNLLDDNYDSTKSEFRKEVLNVLTTELTKPNSPIANDVIKSKNLNSPNKFRGEGVLKHNYLDEDTNKNNSISSENDDNEEFHDLLFKIKQTQVEATSDTDESVDETVSSSKPLSDSKESEILQKEIESKKIVSEKSSIDSEKSKENNVKLLTIQNVTETKKLIEHSNIDTTNNTIVSSLFKETLDTNKQEEKDKISTNSTNLQENDMKESIGFGDSEITKNFRPNLHIHELAVSNISETPEIQCSSNVLKECGQFQQPIDKNISPIQFEANADTHLRIDSDNKNDCDKLPKNTLPEEAQNEICETDNEKSKLADASDIPIEMLLNPDISQSNAVKEIVAAETTTTESVIGQCNDSKDFKNKNDETEKVAIVPIPDSTIQCDGFEEVIKESTVTGGTDISATNHEVNSIVSSSHDVGIENKPLISNKEATKKAEELDAIKSLGNILSVLQDKTKLKLVLNLLNDNSAETEKLKKKLSKLSEIASDDEEDDKKGVDHSEKNEEKNGESTAVTLLSTNVVNVNANTSTKLAHSAETEAKMEKEVKGKVLKKANIRKTENQSEKLGRDEYDFTENEFENEGEPKLIHVKKGDKITKKPTFKRRKMKRAGKKKSSNKNTSIVKKRTTRSDSAQKAKKKGCRELEMLQEDIRDMFISEGVLNATGIRMCRLAKLSEPTSELEPNEDSLKESHKKTLKDLRKDAKPFVVLEKTQLDTQALELHSQEKNKVKRKPGPKRRSKNATTSSVENIEAIVASDDPDKNESSEPTKQKKISNKLRSKNQPSESVEDEQVTVQTCEKSYEIPRNTKTKRKAKFNCKIDDVSPSREDDEESTIDSMESEESSVKIKTRRKPGPKSKSKNDSINILTERKDNEKIFLSDSISENNRKSSLERVIDSDDESLSSFISTESSDKNSETRSKIKRKSMWKRGLIKKKKLSPKEKNISKTTYVSDKNCFTDKNYCFTKGKNTYLCKLCGFDGEQIVRHFKECHSHLEVPLSRLNRRTAAIAIEQSLNTDFDSFRRTVKNKMICRFCFQVFNRKANLERLFWHVVSKHTGEYKYACPICPDDKTKCPALLDIPTPPTENQQLLLGYICGECHYTQISLNNLKTHVALRHDNEETEVYTINLCNVQHDKTSALISTTVADKCIEPENAFKSDRPTKKVAEQTSDVTRHTDNLRMSSGSRIAFENEDDASKEESDKFQLRTIKFEDEDIVSYSDPALDETISRSSFEESDDVTIVGENSEFIKSLRETETVKQEPLDIKIEMGADVPYDLEPHFMITATGAGKNCATYYMCRVPNCDNSFKTPLLIALKRHVQAKHSTSSWDGYCCVCKKIIPGASFVSLQNYSDCLNHMLLNHLDEFPLLKDSDAAKEDENNKPTNEDALLNPIQTQKKYISVKPMSDLLPKPSTESRENVGNETSILKIQSVISLQNKNLQVNASTSISEVSTAATSIPDSVSETSYHLNSPVAAMKKILSEKHASIRESMMLVEKIACLFKCADRYCEFVSRTAANFVEHINSHLKLKSQNHDVLRCVYCGWNAETGDSLSTHVLREHGHCRYACVRCWYLSTSAILVEMHRVREHNECTHIRPLIMKETPGADESMATAGLLSRSDAVLFYTCFGRK